MIDKIEEENLKLQKSEEIEIKREKKSRLFKDISEFLRAPFKKIPIPEVYILEFINVKVCDSLWEIAVDQPNPSFEISRKKTDKNEGIINELIDIVNKYDGKKEV
jgi:hypothetical protein